MAIQELAQIRAATEQANAIWNGTRYVVLSVPDTQMPLALATAEISQITFGESSITYRNTSALSSRTHSVPVRVIPGNVTFSGATIRNTELYKMFDIQDKYLASNNGALEPKNIMVFTYAQNTSQQAVPISIINLIGCQPVSYKPANADANGVNIPLESLTIRPYKYYRVSGDYI